MSALETFYWVVTQNRKVGAGSVVGYAGPTQEAALASCLEAGCPLAPGTEEPPTSPGAEEGILTRCYAWYGSDRMAFASILKKAGSVGREAYSLGRAIAKAPRSARTARLLALGDPGGSNTPESLRAIGRLKEAGFTPMVYTHAWRREDTQPLRPYALASCDTPQEALEALAAGWTPALLAPWNQPYQLQRNGRPLGVQPQWEGWPAAFVDCPAQLADDFGHRAHTCADCRKCSGQYRGWKANGGPYAGVIFRDHGPATRPKLRAARKLKVL